MKSISGRQDENSVSGVAKPVASARRLFLRCFQRKPLVGCSGVEADFRSLSNRTRDKCLLPHIRVLFRYLGEKITWIKKCEGRAKRYDRTTP